MNHEKSNFQKFLITATAENKKILNCNLVNDNFSDFINDKSTPYKDMKSTGNKHIDKNN